MVLDAEASFPKTLWTQITILEEFDQTWIAGGNNFCRQQFDPLFFNNVANLQSSSIFSSFKTGFFTFSERPHFAVFHQLFSIKSFYKMPKFSWEAFAAANPLFKTFQLFTLSWCLVLTLVPVWVHWDFSALPLLTPHRKVSLLLLLLRSRPRSPTSRRTNAQPLDAKVLHHHWHLLRSGQT